MSNASSNYFDKRPDITPTIYALELIGVESHKGYIKVGYTHRTTKERANEQLHTSGVRYRILHEESAMRSDGSCFMDKDVHKVLERKGIRQLNSGYDNNEWYKCSLQYRHSAESSDAQVHNPEHQHRHSYDQEHPSSEHGYDHGS